MEDFGFGIGVLLAIFGPLLLIPVTWLVYRGLTRPLVHRLMLQHEHSSARVWVASLSAPALVALVMAASYFPGKVEFDRLCAQHATPSISRRVAAEGFYRARMFPYEARPFLDEGGFRFVEAPDIYNQARFFRYVMSASGAIDQQAIEELQSRYGVEKTFSTMSFGITMNEKIIYVLASREELARAAYIVYAGGPLSLFLGSYALASCPDAASPEGAIAFHTFYNLETTALRAGIPD